MTFISASSTHSKVSRLRLGYEQSGEESVFLTYFKALLLLICVIGLADKFPNEYQAFDDSYQ